MPLIRAADGTPTEATDDVARLRALTAAALRCALAAWPDTVSDAVPDTVQEPLAPRPAPPTPDVAPVRAALRAVCDAARAHGLRADQLLVLLKRDWAALPWTARVRRDGDDVLSRVVSLCIQEYYESPSPAAVPAPSPPAREPGYSPAIAMHGCRDCRPPDVGRPCPTEEELRCE